MLEFTAFPSNLEMVRIAAATREGRRRKRKNTMTTMKTNNSRKTNVDSKSPKRPLGAQTSPYSDRFVVRASHDNTAQHITPRRRNISHHIVGVVLRCHVTSLHAMLGRAIPCYIVSLNDNVVSSSITVHKNYIMCTHAYTYTCVGPSIFANIHVCACACI